MNVVIIIVVVDVVGAGLRFLPVYGRRAPYALPSCTCLCEFNVFFRLTDEQYACRYLRMGAKEMAPIRARLRILPDSSCRQICFVIRSERARCE